MFEYMFECQHHENSARKEEVTSVTKDYDFSSKFENMCPHLTLPPLLTFADFVLFSLSVSNSNNKHGVFLFSFTFSSNFSIVFRSS